MGKLKRDVCAAEGDCLLFRAPRADRPAELVRAAPAEVGRREFHGGGAFEVSRNFIASSPARSGERGSPGMQEKYRPDWVGRSGRGMSLFSSDADDCGNADISGSG